MALRLSEVSGAVILADGIVQPFERWFDFSTFTAKINTGDMQTLIKDGHHLQQEFHLNSIRFPPGARSTQPTFLVA
jgi:hypothetical protein